VHDLDAVRILLDEQRAADLQPLDLVGRDVALAPAVLGADARLAHEARLPPPEPLLGLEGRASSGPTRSHAHAPSHNAADDGTRTSPRSSTPSRPQRPNAGVLSVQLSQSRDCEKRSAQRETVASSLDANSIDRAPRSHPVPKVYPLPGLALPAEGFLELAS